MIEVQDELLLSELIDGRPVDPDRLGSILENPAGRASLVAFSRLRSQVIASADAPGDGFARRVEARLARSGHRLGRSSVLIAAASLAIGVLLTLALGPESGGEPDGAVDSPPQASRVLRFEEGRDWTESGS